MFFRFGQVVRLHRRVVTGQDELGNDVYGTTLIEVSGCSVSPGTTSENIQGTATVTSDLTIFMPPGTVVDSFDLIDVLDGQGPAYRVLGLPRVFGSPFTGSRAFLEVNVQHVSGALSRRQALWLTEGLLKGVMPYA